MWPHALACSVASAFHAALICYMSQGHGDVALSVLMTTASTLGAIFMTPLLTQLLAGTLVPVDAYVRPLHHRNLTSSTALADFCPQHLRRLHACETYLQAA